MPRPCALRIVKPPAPPETAFGQFADVSPKARALVVEITAEVARLRSLETTPTHQSVKRAQTTIPRLMALLSQLGDAL